MMNRRWAYLVGLAAAVTGGYVLRGFVSGGRPDFAPPAKSGPRPMTEWYYADGRITPEGAGTRQDGNGDWSPSREWIVVYNPGGSKASLDLTFYFENAPPRQRSWQVGPGRAASLAVQDMPEIAPPGLLYGVRVRGDEPVIVQPTRGEYAPSDSVTHAMASFIAYPGPLGSRETKWAYADGLVLASEQPLEEREWVSILNPSRNRPAHVRVRFRGSDQRGSHELVVPPERVRSVDLFRLTAFKKNSLAAVVVESDVPIVVEQIRRAYRRGVSLTEALWACLAHPVGPETGR